MVGEVKQYVKQRVLGVLNRALRTDFLHSTVMGIVEDAGFVRRTELATPEWAAGPYATRDVVQQQPRGDFTSAPVFISARFRSGSTALWNVFRNTPDCTAFYEPFNERRFFDSSTRGEYVDSTHRGVNDYWREYEAISGLEAF